jgi:hypothetical protein
VVTLRIESDPDGADIWLDGVEKGKTPLAIDIAPGTTEHELVLKHAGMKDKIKTLQITDSTTLRLELEKASRTKRPPRDKPKGKEGGEGSGSGSDDDLMRPPWEKKK